MGAMESVSGMIESNDTNKSSKMITGFSRKKNKQTEIFGDLDRRRLVDTVCVSMLAHVCYFDDLCPSH